MILFDLIDENSLGRDAIVVAHYLTKFAFSSINFI
jgi:hypothetical protein